MEYSQEKKEEIKLKIVQLIENSKLNINDDFEILESILKKYNFKTIPNTSKLTGLSKQGLYNKVARDDFPHKIIDGIPFCIVNLNQ